MYIQLKSHCIQNEFDVNSIKNVINKKCQTSLWKSTQIYNLLSINQQTMHRTCYIGRSDFGTVSGQTNIHMHA